MNSYLFKNLLVSTLLYFSFVFQAQALDIFCPPDQWVSCTDEVWDLSNYPNATYHDYSGYHDAGPPVVEYFLNMCDVGTIERTWTVYAYGTSVSCTQTFYVEGGSFGYNDINWPLNDLVLTGCDPNTDPDYLPDGYGAPTYNSPTECAMIAVNYSDQIFTISNTCKKLLRTWQIMDWCTFNSYTGQGLYTHTQVIKIMDNEIPVIEDMDDVVAHSTNCEDAYVNVPMLWTNNASCGGSYTITNDSPYANYSGSDASGVYPIGTTKVTYTVNYGCGGKVYFSVYVIVKDSKAPVPYCLATLNLALMGIDNDEDGVNEEGMVEVWASDLDYGSFHTCPSHYPLSISFSTDPDDNVRVFTCEEVGENLVEMYVIDKFGNYNFCIVKVNIQNNAANITDCQPVQVIELDSIIVTSDNCDGTFVETPMTWLDSTYCDGIDTIFNNSPYAADSTGIASGNYPIGTTEVTYTVFYNCGEEIRYVQTIIVENNTTEISPTPVCVNGLVVVLMGIDNDNDGVNDEGYVEVWASDLDYGSFHECPSHEPLTFSFTSDPTDDLRTYTCDEVGDNIAELWLTDIYGNQAHCVVNISVQNNGANITDCEPEIITADTIPNIIANSDNCQNTFVETPMTWLDTSYCDGINTIMINSLYADSNWDNANGTYPIGSSAVQYTVHYNCGETILYTHYIIVEDNTSPQALCVPSLGLPLVGIDNDGDGVNDEGMVELWASDLDQGSFHDCPSHYPLSLSFSSDTSEVVKLFTCNEIGDNTVELWVTDNYGFQSSCSVVVNVQNNSANIVDCAPEVVVVETLEDLIISADNCDESFVEIPMTWVDFTYCDGIEVFEIVSQYADDININANGTYPLGTSIVTFNVEYLCGEKIQYVQNVIVEGTIKPQPYCIGALDIELIGVDEDGDGTFDDASVELLASSLDFGSHHICESYYPLTFSFSSDTSDQWTVYTCDDIGSNIAQLWVTDKFGNQEYCTVNISVLDNDIDIPDCVPGATSVVVSGAIKTIVGDFIEDIEVSIEEMMEIEENENMSPYEAQEMTDRYGFYMFENLEMYKDYELSCGKELDMHDFVTKEDVRTLYQHITGKEIITDPYFLIAADLNDDGVVNRDDLYPMYYFAHGINEDLGIEKKYVFISTSSTIYDVKDYYLGNYISKVVFEQIDDNAYNTGFDLVVKGDLYSSKAKMHGLRDDVDVVDAEIADYLEDTKSINVYPNPFVEEINIQLEDLPSTDVNVKLYDVNGKLYSNTTYSPSSRLTINSDHVIPGVYYYQVSYGASSYKGKLIKL